MRIFVYSKGILLSGKVREIRALLQKYARRHHLVRDMLHSLLH